MRGGAGCIAGARDERVVWDGYAGDGGPSEIGVGGPVASYTQMLDVSSCFFSENWIPMRAMMRSTSRGRSGQRRRTGSQLSPARRF